MSSGNVSSNQQDTLHYYRITIAGYGGETAYIKVSKKAYEFWNPVIEEGDGDAVEYCAYADFVFDVIDNYNPEKKLSRLSQLDPNFYIHPLSRTVH